MIAIFVSSVLWYNEQVKLRKSAHTLYKTQYHIVWVTRYRRKILLKGVKKCLSVKLQEIRKYSPDWEYREIGIDKDHIHLHMIIPPKYAVSKAVETLKANTSRVLWKKFIFLSKVYWDDGGIWAKGYFVSTVGINEQVIRNYVRMQEKEDTGQAEFEL